MVTKNPDEKAFTYQRLCTKILEDGFFGRELEISIASNIYNINIATYNEIIDNNNPIGYTNINYYNNNDNNQNRHLMILINYNNIHFRMGYYNLTSIIDFNYNIPSVSNNEENESNSEEIFEKNYFSNINELLELKKNFNDFTNKSLNELMELYKEESNEIVGYDDIYYYINQKNKGEIIGKYSEKFKAINKDKNYRLKKQLFRKTCAKFDIDKFKCLIKIVSINNVFSGKNIIKELLVVPPKYITKLLNIYHIRNGHKGYFNLVNDILNDGFYKNGIYIKCRDMNKNCVIFNQNRKNIFRKPVVYKLYLNYQKDIYRIDLTVLPVKLQTDDNAKYLLCIMDIFSKYGYCYILNNKRADTILCYIKDFINKYGKPNGLQSNNGKEFRNSLLSDYCKENGIKFFYGLPYHPQSQGVIESFNKEIKR